MGERRNKFNVDLTPKTSYDKIDNINKTEKQPAQKTTKTKRKRKERPPRIVRRSQVSVLFSEEEYAYVDELAYTKGVAMTRVVLNFLLDKGFFND